VSIVLMHSEFEWPKTLTRSSQRLLVAWVQKPTKK